MKNNKIHKTHLFKNLNNEITIQSEELEAEYYYSRVKHDLIGRA